MTGHLHDRSTSTDIAEHIAEEVRADLVRQAMPEPTLRAAAMKAIAQTVSAAHSAYWTACDAEGRAIDPAALDAPEGLLDDAYETAVKVEVIAAERGVSWWDARALV